MVTKEEQDYIEQLESELSNSNAKISQLNNNIQGLATERNNNVVEYQLEFGELLNRIDHYIRGNILKTDDEGNQYYDKPTKRIPEKNKNGSLKKDNKGRIIYKEIIDEDLVLFNDYGANSIMHIITGYLDKDTVLSNYDEMRIYEILYDLGNELGIFIFCNYERMGMTSEPKKSKYILLVLQILHMIESAYKRSIGGDTSTKINTTSIYSESGFNRPIGYSQSNKKKFNLFKPGTWNW